MLKRSASVVVLSVAIFGFTACGNSSERRAAQKVCATTTELNTHLNKLETLPPSASFPKEVKTGAEAIGENLGELKSATSKLPAPYKEEFEAATKTFEAELAALIAATAKASTSSGAALKAAESQIRASLATLDSAYQTAFASLKCP